MTFRQLARWVGVIVLAVGLTVVSSGSAIAQIAPASAAAPSVTLYDQTNNAGSNSADSTDWGIVIAYRNLFSRAADDFVVPANAIWRITSATVVGAYIGSAGTGILTETVQFYSNSAGLPSTRIFSETIAAGVNPDSGIFVASLSPTLTLGPGHYWFSFQDVVACKVSNCKHWLWTERTLQSQSASVWENPPGSVPACTTWKPRVDTCHVPDPSSGRDLLFKLDGTSVPVVANLMLPIITR